MRRMPGGSKAGTAHVQERRLLKTWPGNRRVASPPRFRRSAAEPMALGQATAVSMKGTVQTKKEAHPACELPQTMCNTAIVLRSVPSMRNAPSAKKMDSLLRALQRKD